MRNLKKILIAIPSEIVFEGIVQILEIPKQDVFRVQSLEELSQFNESSHIDIILIDPLIMHHNLVLFNKVVADFGGAKWVGVVYSYINHSILEQFGNLVYIDDKPEVIKRKVRKLLESERSSGSHIRNTLSEREIDVLRLLVQGNSTKEIAEKLFISTHTVITHRKNISQKTGIKSVSGLTIYAVLNKIIALDAYSK